MYRINKEAGVNITVGSWVSPFSITLWIYLCDILEVFILLCNSFNYVYVHLLQVYHTFHDEVAEYRQHWWRCNGPCQSRKPYFGYVKRAMNRAPGPRDPWFRDHQNSCNGTFIKVKEPENYGKKKKKGEGKSDKTSSKAGTYHFIKFHNFIEIIFLCEE